jgi:hypothetical protein
MLKICEIMNDATSQNWKEEEEEESTQDSST